jgi:hypothetical protein
MHRYRNKRGCANRDKQIGYKYMLQGVWYGTSALLQASVTVAVNSSLKGEDVLSQILLKYDYCEEFGLKFNVRSSPLSMDFKHAASHLDDLKYANFKLAESEKEVQEQE